jgi:2-polyprenyl-3-methyl-5-hydroxy-6-metoxy-1,4-benzoquinol methylase
MKSSVECPCCSALAFPFFKAQDYNRRVTDHYFQYFKCPSCAFIFLNQIPDHLASYYSTGYHQKAMSIEEFSEHAETDRYKLEILEKFISHGKLLEIGPSIGKFAYLSKKQGFDTEVMEMSPDCCHFISSVLGIKTIEGSSIDKDLPKNKRYNVIALWHVLEHLPNPFSALKELVTRLEPEGVLILAAPNPDSRQFKLFQRYWFHLDAPRHLQLIPCSALIQYLDRLGCSLCYKTTQDKGTILCDIAGWQHSIMNWLGLRRPILLRKVISRLLQHSLELTYWMIKKRLKEDTGSAYTLVFKKRA